VRTEIAPASFRDLSYIAANMRPADRADCEAQLGPVHYMELALAHLRDHAYVALVAGNPDCAFGACRLLGDHLWTAWSFGTARIGNAIPAVTRHVRRVMTPDILATSATRMEARAMATNVMACRWLKLMGAAERCDLPGYGRGGETFKLYDWTR